MPYLKLDLTQSEINAHPSFKLLMHENEGIRLCFIAEFNTVWNPQSSQQITLQVPDLNSWVISKIPSIDGTELWLLPEKLQERFEIQKGFSKKSEPLLSFSLKTHYRVWLPTLQASQRCEVELVFKERTHEKGLWIEFENSITNSTEWRSQDLEALDEQGYLAFKKG